MRYIFEGIAVSFIVPRDDSGIESMTFNCERLFVETEFLFFNLMSVSLLLMKYFEITCEKMFVRRSSENCETDRLSFESLVWSGVKRYIFSSFVKLRTV